MDLDTKERTERIAKNAAYYDLSNGRQGSTSRAKWWVGEESHSLGIVDRRGMIDTVGEIARAFEKQYRKMYNREGTFLT